MLRIAFEASIGSSIFNNVGNKSLKHFLNFKQFVQLEGSRFLSSINIFIRLLNYIIASTHIVQKVNM